MAGLFDVDAASGGAPRVVITGLGAVSAAGTGVGALWSLVQSGESAIAPVELFDAAPYGGLQSGEARHLERDPGVERSLQLLSLAVDEVLAHAGWGEGEKGIDTGVVLGTCQGAIEGARGIHRSYFDHPPTEVDEAEERAFREYRPGYGTSVLAEQVGAKGPCATVGMVCVSSSVAILHAVDLLRRGAAKRIVAGGFESFCQFVFTGFHCIGALASGALKPFDTGRDGTVLGEGAVLLCLETLESAEARGARVLAEVLGGGFVADAFHMTAPDPEGRGLERAMRHAFADAGIDAGDIDYISAHGTGTVFNDGMEAKAFGRVFNEIAEAGRMPPISSAKSAFGHTLGAAGALDAVVCVQALREGVFPPSVAHESPITDWDFVAGGARSADEGFNIALSTNSAFGGNNSALILRRYSAGGAA